MHLAAAHSIADNDYRDPSESMAQKRMHFGRLRYERRLAHTNAGGLTIRLILLMSTNSCLGFDDAQHSSKKVFSHLALYRDSNVHP